MKKLNKKGFTIIELVIVIAVIAILAGVMIPTFSSIVTKANESAAQQRAMALYKEVYALDLSDGDLDGQEGKGNYMKYIPAVTESENTSNEKDYTVDDVRVYDEQPDPAPETSSKEYIVYKVTTNDSGNKEIEFTFYVYGGYQAEYKDDKWSVKKTESTAFKSTNE